MTSIRTVLFDLDETLFDHAYGVYHSMSLLRGDHACLQTKPLEALLNEHSRLLESMHPDVLKGRLTIDEARIARMRGLFAFCGAECSDEVARESAMLHRQRYLVARRAVPGARELLVELRARGTRIVIVTNNFLEEQRDKLAHCGLTDLVDVLVTSEEYNCIKPAPEIFHIALKLSQSRVDEAVMVGDSWEVDVVGAQNAGIRPVWFNRWGKPKPVEAVDEITSFEPAAEIASRLVTLPASIAPDLRSHP